MNHREFLLSLSPEQRRRLTEKSNSKGLIRLGQHWGVIFILAALILNGVPAWPILMLPLGVMLVFQFTLLHETVHLTPFSSRWINSLVSRVCGYLLVLPPVWFRHFHLEHHRQTHVLGKDPELASAKPQSKQAFWLHVSGLPLWWSSVKNVWRNAWGKCDDSYVPLNGRAAVQKEAIQMLVFYVLLACGSIVMGTASLLYIWVLPVLLGQPFLRVYLLAEHTGCPHSEDMFANTRTTYTSPLVRWLAWNMPFHAEHHSYAAVPFYRLPEVNEMIKDHLQTTEEGYIAFQAHYRQSLK